jgi:DNA polymerase bacteriophage-type
LSTIFYDVETFGLLSLPDYGVFRYAQHQLTAIRCVSYCIVEDDGTQGPIKTWFPGEILPEDYLAAAAQPSTKVCAFNDGFERVIERFILHPHYNWPVVPLERRRCAQAAAYAAALTGSLDDVAAALKLSLQKNKAAVELMKRQAKPHQQTAKEKRAGAPLDFSITPEELAQLAAYNRNDVAMTIALVERVGLLAEPEQRLWQLDAVVNARGLRIDMQLLEAMLAVKEAAREHIHAQLAELSGGTITTARETKSTRAFMLANNFELSDLRKPTVDAAIADPGTPEPVRKMLELRRGVATQDKLPALARWANGDDLVRGAYIFNGASQTGRFVSRGVQLQNMRKCELENPAAALAALRSGSYEHMRSLGFVRPLDVVGQLVRALPVPAPGKRFFIADLSGVEARACAYLTGHQVELDRWRRFDQTGLPEHDPYFIAGNETFRQPPERARKIGKVNQLAFQYGGGLGAFRRASGDYTTPDLEVERIRDTWRAANTPVTAFWRTSIFQAVQALRNPKHSEWFIAGKVASSLTPSSATCCCGFRPDVVCTIRARKSSPPTSSPYRRSPTSRLRTARCCTSSRPTRHLDRPAYTADTCSRTSVRPHVATFSPTGCCGSPSMILRSSPIPTTNT